MEPTNNTDLEQRVLALEYVVRRQLRVVSFIRRACIMVTRTIEAQFPEVLKGDVRRD